MSAKNPDLVAVQKQLVGVVDALARQQEDATTADAIKAIAREIAEVNHRVTMVGQLVFKERTEKIKAAVQLVVDDKKKVDDAIKGIQKLNAFLKTITAFLALVDKVIDTAKLVA